MIIYIALDVYLLYSVHGSYLAWIDNHKTLPLKIDQIYDSVHSDIENNSVHSKAIGHFARNRGKLAPQLQVLIETKVLYNNFLVFPVTQCNNVICQQGVSQLYSLPS